jgi:hypothetical protein
MQSVGLSHELLTPNKMQRFVSSLGPDCPEDASSGSRRNKPASLVSGATLDVRHCEGFGALKNTRDPRNR